MLFNESRVPHCDNSHFITDCKHRATVTNHRKNASPLSNPRVPLRLRYRASTRVSRWRHVVDKSRHRDSVRASLYAVYIDLLEAVVNSIAPNHGVLKASAQPTIFQQRPDRNPKR